MKITKEALNKWKMEQIRIKLENKNNEVKARFYAIPIYYNNLWILGRYILYPKNLGLTNNHEIIYVYDFISTDLKDFVNLEHKKCIGGPFLLSKIRKRGNGKWMKLNDSVVTNDDLVLPIFRIGPKKKESQRISIARLNSIKRVIVDKNKFPNLPVYGHSTSDFLNWKITFLYLKHISKESEISSIIKQKAIEKDMMWISWAHEQVFGKRLNF